MGAFLTTTGVSAVLLFLGVAVFVVLCYRGINTATSALIGACIVALGATTGFAKGIFDTWIGGVGNFVARNGLAFISAGLFSYLMRETRSGEAIGQKMVKIFSINKAPYILTITAVLLQLAGINTYIFIVATMAFSLMKSADLPITVGYAACVGVPPIISFSMPGVTALPNVLPTTYLGTNLYAAPALSLAVTLLGAVLYVVYIEWLVRRARKKQIGYNVAEGKEADGAMFDDIELPKFSVSIIPILAVILLTALFQLKMKIQAIQAMSYAMWITSVLIVLMNWNTCMKRLGIKRILSSGPTEMFGFIMMAGCVVGFGAVTQIAACFQPLMDAILSIHCNPYMTAWLTIALIAGLAADGIGGLMMWLGMFGPQYAAMPEVNNGALHRILVTTSTTFDSLPHSGMVAQGLAVFKLTHKEGYTVSFVLTVITPAIFSLFAVLLAIIFY